MQFKIPLTFLTLLVQGAGAGPPVPKTGPAPPVGDVVPIDESIWILLTAAFLIGLWHLYRRLKEASSTN